MMSVLLWKDVKKELPEVNKKCLCMTSNGNFLISEMQQSKDSNNNSLGDKKRWKGSSRATESITKWSYLDIKSYGEERV